MEIENDIEFDLNRQVDDVMQHMNEPPKEDVDQRVLTRTLVRLTTDIQQVINLVTPLSAPTADLAGRDLGQEDPQPANIVNAAKTLLIAQIDELRELAGKIE